MPAPIGHQRALAGQPGSRYRAGPCTLTALSHVSWRPFSQWARYKLSSIIAEVPWKGGSRGRRPCPPVAVLMEPPLQGEQEMTNPESESVAIAVHELTYEVGIAYQAKGRSLERAARIWAHCGHSGWRDAVDIELRKLPGRDTHWVGEYRVPAYALPVVSHLEVQLAFKGQLPDGHVMWDNNRNQNWNHVVELTSGKGVVQGNAAAYCPKAISSLLLRLDHLAANKMLNREQAAMLRTWAWRKDFALLKAFQEAKHLPDALLAESLKARCSFLKRPGIHVVHVASEMAPIAKVGGLADVVTSLSRAHQDMGNLVEIILPKYDCINYSAVTDLRRMVEIDVPWDGKTVRTIVWSGVAEGLPVYFLEPHSDHRYFWRGTIYGCTDDVERFLFFSRAALELLVWSGKRPEAVHVHDWQTAAVAPMLHELYRETSLGCTASVLTLHNLAFQGRESPALLHKAGFDTANVYTPGKLQDSKHTSPEGQYDINILQGGIVYADKVTTVSPRYAEEVLNTDLSFGLQDVLQKAFKEGRFKGVLNGIDTLVWDPSVDTHIPHQYGEQDCTHGKLVCKQQLLSELGLPWHGGAHPSGKPLLAVVSRLTEQKGLPLILHGIRVAVQQGAQVVLLGSAPDPEVHKQFVQMQQEFQATDCGRIILRFDEGLSHRIYAAADMILIPSAFEPCGLTQLISLRYGTVCIVRETGGLADTVTDVFHSDKPEDLRNGYVFHGSNHDSVAEAVTRAVDAYYNSWEWWSRELVPRCMAQDWSWQRSAQQYVDLYNAVACEPGFLAR